MKFHIGQKVRLNRSYWPREQYKEYTDGVVFEITKRSLNVMIGYTNKPFEKPFVLRLESQYWESCETKMVTCAGTNQSIDSELTSKIGGEYYANSYLESLV